MDKKLKEDELFYLKLDIVDYLTYNKPSQDELLKVAEILGVKIRSKK